MKSLNIPYEVIRSYKLNRQLVIVLSEPFVSNIMARTSCISVRLCLCLRCTGPIYLSGS